MSRPPQHPVQVWCTRCRTRMAVYLGHCRECADLVAKAATVIPMALRCIVCRTARAVKHRRCRSCGPAFEQLEQLERRLGLSPWSVA